jgi:hypothetical protein
MILLGSMTSMSCSGQGEGERCDPANHDDDCESGLSCVPLSALNRGTTGAVCCPKTNATADICLQVDFSGEDEDPNDPPSSTVPTSGLPSTPAAPSNSTPGLDGGSVEAGVVEAGSPADAGHGEPLTSDSGAVVTPATSSDAAAITEASAAPASTAR